MTILEQCLNCGKAKVGIGITWWKMCQCQEGKEVMPRIKTKMNITLTKIQPEDKTRT